MDQAIATKPTGFKSLDKLDAQNFGPNDSVIASTINHPIDAITHFVKMINENKNIMLDPSSTKDQQAEAALALASFAQPGSFSNKLSSRFEISDQLDKWLSSVGVDRKLRSKLVKINEDVEKNDRPGEIVKDNKGNVLFSSNNNAAHIIRQAIGSDKFARQYANALKLNSDGLLRDNVTIGLLHDIGKTRTPRDVINRARHFPPEGMTYADMQNISYEPGNLGDMMNNVIKRNPDADTKFNFGLSKADNSSMQNHVNSWEEASNSYQVPKDLSRKANMHHLHYDGNPYASYPKEFADIKGKQIPIETRIQSIFDSTDAASSPRYGESGPASYDELMKDKLEFYRGKSTLGTQFDNNLFKLARDSGHIKNYYDNIANKEGYQLADLIKNHRKEMKGNTAIEDFIPKDLVSFIQRLALIESSKKKD